MTYIDDAYPEELDDAYKEPQHFPMTLNKAQFEQFVCNYVQHIVDGLDTESLECMLSDLLFTVYQTYTEKQILGEVTEIYGEEVASDLLESVDPHMPVA
jgi:flagellar motor component MotA